MFNGFCLHKKQKFAQYTVKSTSFSPFKHKPEFLQQQLQQQLDLINEERIFTGTQVTSAQIAINVSINRGLNSHV
jgi:hypothetical protein